MEPLTFAALVVAAVSPLYQILRRHYDVKNSNLEFRVDLARELKNACEQWSSLLEKTFDNAVRLLNDQGPEAARSEIEHQQQDFTMLDYRSLAGESEALKGLRTDPRFRAFADACARFYLESIEVKRIAYEEFDLAGRTYTLRKDGFKKVAQLWKLQVEQALEGVRSAFRGVESIRHS